MPTARYSLKVYSLRVQEPPASGEPVRTPEIAKRIARGYFSAVRDDREHFIALALTTQHRFLGVTEVALGGASSAVVDPKVLFRALLVRGAGRFILAHNHPSGDTAPSPEDQALTRRLVQGGEILSLSCLDHLIVGDGTGRILSFSEAGRMPQDKEVLE